MGTHNVDYVEQELLTTFVTCEGDLSDPQFNTKFARLLKQLQKLLLKGPGQYLGVVKVEPWNSVRVTFTVPKEAALRLRQLAQQGDLALSQLGILSVQLEGDQAISLRIAGHVSGESQEIVLRTTSADSDENSNQTSATEIDHFISKSTPASASESTASLRTLTQDPTRGGNVNQPLVSFKNSTVNLPNSSNSVASVPPKGSKVPAPHSYQPPVNTTSEICSIVPKSANLPTKINHQFSQAPPPYPYSKPTNEMLPNGSPPNVALSSPLLVNLLKNVGETSVGNSKEKRRLFLPSEDIVKVTDRFLDVLNNINQLQPPDGSQFSSIDLERQVVQRIHKVATSEPLTMVTNMRIPKTEPQTWESVIVSANKLPTMNHLTAVTASVKQTYSQDSLCVQQSSMFHQSREQQQQHIVEPQQIKPKHLLQQQQRFQSSQQLMQLQKSVILPQNVQGTKINMSSVQFDQDLVGTGNRILNQLSNNSLPQQHVSSSETKFENLLFERNKFAAHSQMNDSIFSQPNTQNIHSSLLQNPNSMSVTSSASIPTDQSNLKPSVFNNLMTSSDPSCSSFNGYQSSVTNIRNRIPVDNFLDSNLHIDLQPVRKTFQTFFVNNEEGQSSIYPNSPSPLPQYPSNVDSKLSLESNTPEGTNTFIDSNTSESTNTSFTAIGDKEPQFLINPLTGEMEAMPVEGSDKESDNQNICNSLSSSVAHNEDSCFSFPSLTNYRSNPLFSDDDDDDENFTTKREVDLPDIVKVKSHRTLSAASCCNPDTGGEKIKIRLKLPSNNIAKKVDKPTSIVKPMLRVLISSTPPASTSVANTDVDEPRVPPLRLNLRGKNYSFKKKNRKWSDKTETVAEHRVDKKAYFNENKVLPNELLSEKEYMMSDIVDFGVDEDDENFKVTPKKLMSYYKETNALTIQTDVNDVASYNAGVLSTIRTFPTEAEVTSILRSVPLDAPNKMSLSSVKLKKREAKKKVLSRGRTTILTVTNPDDDEKDTFNRVINETKRTLFSQSKGKSKCTTSSLLKNMMKSSATKETRLMTMMNRNSEKKIRGHNNSSGHGSAMNPKSGAATIGVQHHRASADISLTAINKSFSNVMQQQKTTSADMSNLVQLSLNSTVPSTNHLYNVINSNELKKLVTNVVAAEKVNGQIECKESYSNPESKESSGRDPKKKLGRRNVVGSCIDQIDLKSPVSAGQVLPTANLNLSVKLLKQRLLEDIISVYNVSSEKNPRLDAAEAATALTPKNGTLIDGFSTLPNNNKEGDEGESLSGSNNEQINNQGEDSGIESMDALSEKSPNQEESPRRKDENTNSAGAASKIELLNTCCNTPTMDGSFHIIGSGTITLECERKRGESECKTDDQADENITNGERSETLSSDFDDVQPFRVIPALYTYSNPEKVRIDSPSPILEDIVDEIITSQKVLLPEESKTTSTVPTRLKRKRRDVTDPIVMTMKSKGTATINRYKNKNTSEITSKSLLKQLLIDIPSDNNVDMRRTTASTMNTRSQVKGLSQPPNSDTLSVFSTFSSSSVKARRCSPVRSEDVCSKLSPRLSSISTIRGSYKPCELGHVSDGEESNPGPTKKRFVGQTDLIKTCFENSIATTPAAMVISGKTNVDCSLKRPNPNTPQSTDEMRSVGKRRKVSNDAVCAKRTNATDSPQVVDDTVCHDKLEDEPGEIAMVANIARNNNHAPSKNNPSTPSTSRWPVRLNHVTWRRKSVGMSNEMSVPIGAMNDTRA